MRRLVLAIVLLGLVEFAGAATAEDSTPQQVFDAMRAAFQPQQAAGVSARYQWLLRDPQGGDWFVEVHGGKCRFGRGRIPNPDVTFVASGRDWVAISNGKLGGTWAYLTGRLKIRGDQRLARKLDEMFP